MYQQTKLKNGLRVISAPITGVHGVTTAVFVKAGSRYETDRIAGLSHFVEHMVFKGTSKRPSQSDISRAIEGIGGYLNAATGQDHTFFYNRVPARHASAGLEVLSDMMRDPLLRAEDIKLEKNVIIEELNMYRDMPSRYIYDLIMNLMWPDNPLGRDIIGTKKSIRSVRRSDFVSYMKKMYHPENMAIVASGKIKHNEFVKNVQKYFNDLEKSNLPKIKKAPAKQSKPQVLVHSKKTDQAHLCLAVRGLPYNDRDLPALALLDIILGTGMSSRLFCHIREKRGLCYSIHSFVERYEDTGLLGVTAGLNVGKIEEAISAIVEELFNFTQTEVSGSELREAKEYLRGSTLLQTDSTDNMTNWYGLQSLFSKRLETPEQKIAKLMKVTSRDIMNIARRLIRKDQLNLAIIGPYDKKDERNFNKILQKV